MMSLFGTNGIRGVLNESLDPMLGYKFGMAVTSYYGAKDVALAYDNRTTSDIFRRMAISGILNAGGNVVDLGFIPTPAIQVYCKLKKIPGIVVTASHNPPEFNGLKVVDREGANSSKGEEAKIEEMITRDSYKKTSWDQVGTVRSDDAVEPYISEILKNVQVDSIKKRKFNVLVDCANSTTLITTPLLLHELGTRYVSINGNPDSFFPGREPEPKEENIGDLQAFARTGGFELSVAHDGDGDRALFLDEKGEIIDGDKFVALVADYILEKQKGDLVFPVASSFLIDRIAEKHNVSVIRTPVGAPIISQVLKEVNGLMGGEENGKVILPSYLNAGDGGLSVALALDIIAEKGMEISRLVKELPDYKLRRLKFSNTQDLSALETRVREFYKDMKEDHIDGLRLTSNDSFILVRPSGTEPAVRVYLSSRDSDWIESREREIVKMVSA